MADITGTVGDDEITGTNENDNINGMGGDDTIRGLAGNDVIDGYYGSDTIFGGDGDDLIYGGEDEFYLTVDTIDGGAGDDTIYGGESNDILIDGEGSDHVYGGGGSDTIYASVGAGEDVYDGATGGFSNSAIDMVSYRNALAGMIVDLTADSDQARSAGNADAAGVGVDQLVLINAIEGSAFADTITGDDQENTLNGGEGNDTINGGAGFDTIDAGAGDDLVSGGDDSDTIIDGRGADVVRGDGGGDRFYASVDHANDRFEGGADEDSIYYTDALSGLIIDNSGMTHEVRSAGAEDAAGVGVDTLVDVEGVHASAFADVLIGGSGRDIVYAEAGDDILDGGDGDDFFDGSVGNDRLTGGNGDDFLIGGTGNDVIDGGSGFDRLAGGYGNDIYYVDSSFDTLERDDEGYDIVYASVSYSLLQLGIGFPTSPGIEELRLTGNAAVDGSGDWSDNVIRANSASNYLTGYSGDDRLLGYAGHDTLDGGEGVDRLYGGEGNDTYIVTDASDFAYENAGEGTDTVEASVSHRLRPEVERLLLTGEDAITGIGNSLNNVITGNSASNGLYGGEGDDRLYGNDGRDRLDGGAGADRLYGGAGDDSYYVRDATDYAYEEADGGYDTAYSAVTLRLRDNIEDLRMVGTANLDGTGNGLDNLMIGNSGANRMYGAEGADQLNGQAGNDWLEGGSGRDIFYGGSGADTFTFRDGDFSGTTGTTADLIRDFSQAEGDVLRLNIVDANTALAADQAFAFVGIAAFTGTAGELRYQQISGNTYVQGDTNGDGAADFWIRLDGLHTLTTGDFVF